MYSQSRIKRTLSKPDALAYVVDLLDSGEFLHRTELAEFLCEECGFHDARGQPQRDGCVKALRELEASGHFTLPAAQAKTGPNTPRRLPEAVSDPMGVPAQAGEVRGLALILVSGEEQMRIWNEMMIREHPRSHGPLVGRQVRYLIDSEHGWLGAMGFAAPALQLADRDRWIGWTVERRRASLHTVVNMSRFPIRPGVHCANLASRLLAMAARQMPVDFERRYHYRPFLMESFVDTARFAGTSYQAANWIRVGRTQGRGRQDRARQASETVEDIYVYPQEKDFRAQLGLAADAGRSALGPADGLEAETCQDHLRHAAAQRAVVVDLGEAQVFERHVPQLAQRRVGDFNERRPATTAYEAPTGSGFGSAELQGCSGCVRSHAGHTVQEASGGPDRWRACGAFCPGRNTPKPSSPLRPDSAGCAACLCSSRPTT
jgi:hypothetical protein